MYTIVSCPKMLFFVFRGSRSLQNYELNENFAIAYDRPKC